MNASYAVVAAVLLGVAGCAAAPASPGQQLITTQSTTVKAGMTDNGHTLTLNKGQRLVVSLDTTYWTFTTPASVVNEAGRPNVVAAHTCRPGMGCGTVTATFDAVGAGQATIAASRTSCGEAMRCVGNAGVYRLTVVVRP